MAQVNIIRKKEALTPALAGCVYNIQLIDQTY